jgi:uncharacterized membrane protein
MEQTRKMDSSNSFIMVTAGFVTVFLQWLLADIPWYLDSFWKMVMSALYGGIGAVSGYYTRKYIITHMEKHGGFWAWMKVIWKRRRDPDNGEPPKQ